MNRSVAIIGIGCRYPGGVDGPTSFWHFLEQGGDGVVEVPANRWDWSRFHDPRGGGRARTNRGGFLTHWDPTTFDPSAFGLTAREAAKMDPQQRLLLEVGVEAMDDAGVQQVTLAAGRTGVFMGAFSVDWLTINFDTQAYHEIDARTPTAGSATMLSARVAHAFDLKGPCLSIDTACSSSLVAFHYAVQSVSSGESDVALAGGVNMMLRPEVSAAMSAGGFLSPDGRSKSFDVRADGYGRGEGCGVVILKPLDAALRDEDRIYAVVRGSGVNQDGRTPGISVPSGDAQRRLIERVIEESGVNPSEVGYVEAHGTGTTIGDQTECQTIGETYGRAGASGTPCYIGSAKSGIGHLEAGAGIAGLIKAALVLRAGKVPPQAQLGEVNPALELEASNLAVARTLTPLQQRGKRLFAAVNSFGYGGTNAHAILERGPLDAVRRADAPGPRAAPAGRIQVVGEPHFVLPISAHSPAALSVLAERYDTLLAEGDAVDAGDICWSATHRRSHLGYRAAATGRDVAALRRDVQAIGLDSTKKPTASGRVIPMPSGSRNGIVFVYSGRGPQWWGMAQDLITKDRDVRKVAEQCDEAFQAVAGWSILERLLENRSGDAITDTRYGQPAGSLVQICLTQALRGLGIAPAAILGHSMGEIASAHACGALSIEQAMQVAHARSTALAPLSGVGTLLAVGCPVETAQELVAPMGEAVSIAGINSPNAVTLSGNRAALEEIAAVFDENGMFARFVAVDVPYHSPYTDETEDTLAKHLAGLLPAEPHTPVLSTVTGDFAEPGAFDAPYWFSNVRNPVRFCDAITAAIEAGYRHFIEIGPHPALRHALLETASHLNKSVSVTTTLSKKTDDTTALKATLGGLYVAGCDVPWTGTMGQGRRAALPSYPWQRERIVETFPRMEHHLRGEVRHPLLGRAAQESGKIWVSEVNAVRLPWLNDHGVDGAIVFPGAAFVEIGAAIQRLDRGRESFAITNVAFERGLVIGEDSARVLNIEINADDRTLTVGSFSPASPGGDLLAHATMRLSAGTPAPRAPQDPGGWTDESDDVVDVDAFYADLTRQGLHYGPSFRPVRAIRRSLADGGVRTIYAEIDASAGAPYVLHPGVLDACFQSMIASVDDAAFAGKTFVPTAIRSLKYHTAFDTGLVCIGGVTAIRGNQFSCDFMLFTRDGQLVLDAAGLTVTAIERTSDTDAALNSLRYHMAWRPLESSGEALNAAHVPQSFVALLDNGGRGQAAVNAMRAAGNHVAVANRADLDATVSAHDDATLLDFTALDATAEDGGAQVLTGLRDTIDTLMSHPIRGLVIVTEGAQPVGRAEVTNWVQAGVLGGLRVVATEFGSRISLRCVDVGSLRAIDEIAEFPRALQTPTDDLEIAVRGKTLYVPLVEADNQAKKEEQQSVRRALGDKPAMLTLTKPGRFENLRWVDCNVAESVGDAFTVEVEAVALNFKDVLKTLGMLPDEALEGTYHRDGLGMEVTARVVATGPEVKSLKVGDRIVGVFYHGFRTHMTMLESDAYSWVRPLEGISAARNAGLPAVALTAYYTLTEIARLQRGENVLIHAAGGGVGQAAVQLALRIGARIFATAGSEEKRMLLRTQGCHFVYNSRALDFAEDLLRDSDGHGVDVVLNSIGGEAAEISMDLLAPWGRFVEIGKRDYLQNVRMQTRAFNRSIAYTSVDIDRMQGERPKLFKEFFVTVWEKHRAGELPIPDVTVFDADHVVDAFRYLGQSKNVGKVVVTLDPQSEVDVWPPEPDVSATFAGDGAILVTGGLQGFGLATARWLAAHGARHLILVSRRGMDSDGAPAIVEALAQEGIKADVRRCDVTDYAAVQALIAAIQTDGTRLRGVFHAAGVLDDALVTNLTPEQIERVVSPKVVGAWALHCATQDLTLDHFVLYSSISAVVGTEGQFAYAAANASLDALAHYRRGRGLPAISVNWGVIGKVGMATRDPRVIDRSAQVGLSAMAPDAALNALLEALPNAPAQLVVADVDWQRWKETAGDTRIATKISALAEESGAGENALVAALKEVEPGERRDIVGMMLAEVLAETLQLPADRIDQETSLTDLGLDSLMTAELQTRLGEIGIQLSTMELTQGQTILQLATTVLRKSFGADDKTKPAHSLDERTSASA